MTDMTSEQRDEAEKIAKGLSEAQRRELQAACQQSEVLDGGKSFLMRKHWSESGYSTLVRRGLVEWGDPPGGFDKRMFAGTKPTSLGKRVAQVIGE